MRRDFPILPILFLLFVVFKTAHCGPPAPPAVWTFDLSAVVASDLAQGPAELDAPPPCAAALEQCIASSACCSMVCGYLDQDDVAADRMHCFP